MIRISPPNRRWSLTAFRTLFSLGNPEGGFLFQLQLLLLREHPNPPDSL